MGENGFAGHPATAKVAPMETEDQEGDLDRSLFLQRALTVINDADKVRQR
jgi:hypothetical protein